MIYLISNKDEASVALGSMIQQATSLLLKYIIWVYLSLTERYWKGSVMIMKKDYSKLGTLFKSMFMLSACTFGGGFVIVSLMKKKFVEELKWLEEDEMLDVTAITQSAPGPLPVNASVIIPL